MIRTHIPISAWEAEGEAVINTAFRLIFTDDHDLDEDGQSEEAWREMGLLP